MIVTPVNWFQATSPLKLMMDRLVCADGGNPDPTLTHGKDPAKAKAEELKGWHYPSAIWPAACSRSWPTAMPKAPEACAASFTTG